MKIPPLTDNEIIQMLIAGGADRERAWKYMYENWRTYYSKPIRKKGGIQDEVDAALHLVSSEFENRVTAANKPPIKNLRGYLVICVRNKWLKLKKRESFPTVELSKSPEPSPEISPEEMMISKELKTEMDKLLDKIGRQCKDILTFWAGDYNMKEIAQKLQFRNAEQVRKRKYKCLKKLERIIRGGNFGK